MWCVFSNRPDSIGLLFWSCSKIPWPKATLVDGIYFCLHLFNNPWLLGNYCSPVQHGHGLLVFKRLLEKKKTYILKLAYKLAGLHNVFIHPQCWLASPLPPPLPCPLTSFPTLSFHVTGSTILLPLKLLGFHFSKGLSSFRAYIDAPNHTHKSPRWKLGSTRERMCGIFCSWVTSLGVLFPRSSHCSANFITSFFCTSE